MPPEVPLATYRVQLSSAFGFAAAASIVPYLKALGISHLYASPFLKARPSSSHGYDVVDFGKLNPEFGGEEGFAELSAALIEADLGLILDFVPNHMAIGGGDNAWWLDVLEFGPKSPYASTFDIDWQALPYRSAPGVLLPFLAAPYGEVLEGGQIVLRFDAGQGTFSVFYHDHRLPIRPESYSELLRTLVEAAAAGNESAGRQLLELAEQYRGPRRPAYDEAANLKAALSRVAGAADVLAKGLIAYQAASGDARRTRALHRLLERQHYRLAHWRLAASAINYRRFFDINHLAGIRVEDARCFANVHRLVAKLIGERRLHGLRLDHIDGLADPRQYCRRLQRLIAEVKPQPARPFYIVVEKILADGEALPDLPGVAGTTGYEWLNLISRVLLRSSGLEELKRLRCLLAGDRSFAEVVRCAKQDVLESMLSSEFDVLAKLLARIAAGQWHTRDWDVARLRAALELFVVEFAVYRTYLTAAGAEARDRALISEALARARCRWTGADRGIFDFLNSVLTLDLAKDRNSGYSARRLRRFVFKLQQFTGPVMAKAVEDTAFYRFVELLALNEVGGDPALPQLEIAEFHQRLAARSSCGLNATATHDTKRGEDARMRILALAELAEEFGEELASWRACNADLIAHPHGRRAPSLAAEYLLYQALLGAWPLAGADATFIARFEAYALKAAREAKQQTSWLNPDEGYEAGLRDFVRGLFEPDRSAAFLQSFVAFAERVALLGALNSLSQLVLKAMMPGVPDFYQGSEFWDLSLVDPDNRRAVNFAARAAALAMTPPQWPALAAAWRDGTIKLALTMQLLALRAALPERLRGGGYRPIGVSGPDREHVIAFARCDPSGAVVVVVGRHFRELTQAGRRWPAPSGWNAQLALSEFGALADALMPGRVLPAGDVPLSSLFQSMPVAVLKTCGPKPPR